eukprot:1398724-Rhodomonas_salina.2
MPSDEKGRDCRAPSVVISKSVFAVWIGKSCMESKTSLLTLVSFISCTTKAVKPAKAVSMMMLKTPRIVKYLTRLAFLSLSHFRARNAEEISAVSSFSSPLASNSESTSRSFGGKVLKLMRPAVMRMSQTSGKAQQTSTEYKSRSSTKVSMKKKQLRTFLLVRDPLGHELEVCLVQHSVLINVIDLEDVADFSWQIVQFHTVCPRNGPCSACAFEHLPTIGRSYSP